MQVLKIIKILQSFANYAFKKSLQKIPKKRKKTLFFKVLFARVACVFDHDLQEISKINKIYSKLKITVNTRTFTSQMNTFLLDNHCFPQEN